MNEHSGQAVLTTSPISDNDAEEGGGGIANAGQLSVLNTTLSDNNTDGGSGGGIFDEGSSSLTVANSTLAGNTTESPVGNGGGIASIGAATVTLLNTTVSANRALHGAGGGIEHASSGALVVRNTILSANVAYLAANADCMGASITGDYDLISTADGCTFRGNPTHNQYAGSAITSGSSTRATSDFLSYHGSITPVLPISPDSVDSNAIHNGDEQVCLAAPIDSKDQRGFPRGPHCDMGAYDTFGDSLSPTTFYVDGVRGSDSNSRCINPGIGACKTINQAVTKVVSGETIDIAPGVYNEQHLILNRGYLTLEGDGAGAVLDGGSTATVLTVDPGVTAGLTNLIVRNGNGENGGGIANQGMLTLFNSQVMTNTASNGGGIDNQGTLALSNSQVTYNNASQGGGIANQGTLLINQSSILDNVAQFSGGGIYSLPGVDVSVGGLVHIGADTDIHPGRL